LQLKRDACSADEAWEAYCARGAMSDHTAAALAQMRRLGVTTALDDFGSNSISLTSLRRCSYDF
jgi:EAL domain-containing protein (putative c-di-GMP-specific phosphodiesterase class I)